MMSGAEKVAVELGLPLNRTISMNDLGVSAYTGENRISGALAGFLQLVREGRIAVGSVLIMDALDRFSREDPLDAIEPYVQVLKAGVDIYTLVDRRRHSRNVRGMAGAVQLMLSMMQFGVGNEESSKKSYRLNEVWGEKRVKAAEHRTPMTALTPGWIHLDENRQFQIIKDRAKIVLEIFQAAAAGIGKRTIAKRYADVPTWGRGKKAGQVFYESYVQKLLNDRRVLGEFAPTPDAAGTASDQRASSPPDLPHRLHPCG
jgi:DNA invertase Pin-like site-specific DNA recombinase